MSLNISSEAHCSALTAVSIFQCPLIHCITIILATASLLLEARQWRLQWSRVEQSNNLQLNSERTAEQSGDNKEIDLYKTVCNLKGILDIIIITYF